MSTDVSFSLHRMDMSIQDSHEAEKNLKSQATKFVKFDEELKGSSHGPMASCVSFFSGCFLLVVDP